VVCEKAHKHQKSQINKIMAKLVVGNLKMNLLSVVERERYLNLFRKEIEKKEFSRTEVCLCPPIIHLEVFKKELGEKIAIGAQNIFWEREGSFTGEISVAMVKNFGAEYVILGHSERRKYFGENNKTVNLKIQSALKTGMKPIACVGETIEEKKRNQTMMVITRQLKESLFEVNRTKAENITIAYEPVWAVGSDQVPTSNDIMSAKILIRKVLIELFEKKYAEEVRIIYGGSVSTQTVKETCLDPAMDGVLIGRESLTPYEFLKITEIINRPVAF